MNKHLYLIVYIVLGAVSLAGCGQPDAGVDWEPTDYNIVNNLEGVTMTVQEETVSPTGLTLTLANNSDRQCIYGEHYVLEKKINQDWYRVPLTYSLRRQFSVMLFEKHYGAELSGNWEENHHSC